MRFVRGRVYLPTVRRLSVRRQCRSGEGCPSLLLCLPRQWFSRAQSVGLGFTCSPRMELELQNAGAGREFGPHLLHLSVQCGSF